MRSIITLALCLIAHTCFAQSIKVESFDASVARSVKIEQLPDSVAVIFSGPVTGKTGAYLQVTSDKKWATPVYDGIEITQTKTPGQWIMFAPAGKYRVLLAEFDPDTGPRYTYHDVQIGKGSTPPTDPTDPPPPGGDYTAVTKAARQGADALNDPPTRQALATAYKAALAAVPGKSYDEARAVVVAARSAALGARKGPSRDVDWNAWLRAVDAELTKVSPVGDVPRYIKAIEAIIAGL